MAEFGVMHSWPRVAYQAGRSFPSGRHIPPGRNFSPARSFTPGRCFSGSRTITCCTLARCLSTASPRHHSHDFRGGLRGFTTRVAIPRTSLRVARGMGTTRDFTIPRVWGPLMAHRLAHRSQQASSTTTHSHGSCQASLP